jgi:hypothetical protein
MAEWPSVGATRLGSRAEIGPKITRNSACGRWRIFRAVSARHFADTSAESSAQMRDDFEATSSAIWCRANEPCRDR